MDVAIFGLGAIGSNLLVQLIKQYPDSHFSAVDCDVVEERNIATQAYFLEHIGMAKALAITSVLQRKLRKFNCQIINTKIREPKQMAIGNKALVVDCFDNAISRGFVKGLSDHVLHIGFSPEFAAEIIWDPHYDVPNDIAKGATDICDFGEASSFINYVVNFAAIVIDDFVKTQVKNNYIITNKVRIRKL